MTAATFTENHVNDFVNTRVQIGAIPSEYAIDCREWICNDIANRGIVVQAGESLKRFGFTFGEHMFAIPVVYAFCNWILNNPLANLNTEKNTKIIARCVIRRVRSLLNKRDELNPQNLEDCVSIAFSYLWDFNPNGIICQPVSMQKTENRVFPIMRPTVDGMGERLRETKTLQMWKIVTGFVANPDTGKAESRTIEVCCPEYKLPLMRQILAEGGNLLFVKNPKTGILTFQSRKMTHKFNMACFRAVSRRLQETIGGAPPKNKKQSQQVKIFNATPDTLANYVQKNTEDWVPDFGQIFDRMAENDVTETTISIVRDHYQMLKLERVSFAQFAQHVFSYCGTINTIRGLEDRVRIGQNHFRFAYEELRYSSLTGEPLKEGKRIQRERKQELEDARRERRLLRGSGRHNNRLKNLNRNRKK